ncbi:cytochrome b/b6 domain-containing protein [Sphingopyxis kveilinensis]|uniref:cytochrome b/b6 domain-containing protein n=1 Tax=Sphingopyxis kveilinensis TaxID=3114367 RepID=UPI0030D34ED9
MNGSVAGTENVGSPAAEELRHALGVRIAHWVNMAAFFGLLASGIGILIAFPELHWGETGYPGKAPWLSFGIESNFDHTTWGRNVHFLCAWVFVINGLVYLLSGLLGRHFRTRLFPTRAQWHWRHIIADVRQHLTFKAPHGGPAHDYNFLQKLSYLIVIFLLLPVMLLTGLTMSPGVTAAFPELFWMFGGRQSARTIHFLTATLLVAFVLVHVWQVILTGASAQIRAMITGRAPTVPEEEAV